MTGSDGVPAGTAEVYEPLRPLLFSIAYRMLGTVSDAEDILQETFLRYHRAVASGDRIDSPKAFLSAVTTRLCVDHLRSARVRRESYIGQWLPEPLLTDTTTPDPAGVAEQADSLSMAFLLLLERLTPVERAVFLLHDVFGYEYAEVAEIVRKSEDNCRQLVSRARRHVGDHRPRFEASRDKREELADRFFSAVGDGDMDGLVGLLARDAVVYGDGGGAGPSWLRPIAGRDNAARLLLGLSGQIQQAGITIRRAEINGQPGGMFLDPDGNLINVFVLDIVGGVVQTVRSVINPEKLRHIGPVADVPELRRRLRAKSSRPGREGG